MHRMRVVACAVWLLIASSARGDAVLLKNGTLLKGRIDYQTASRVVLEITSYTRIPFRQDDVALCVFPAGERSYTRFSDGTDGGEAGLQIATLLFEHPRSHKAVSLVGAIHVGDASYYRRLRTILNGHDRVLYELVTGAKEDGFSELLGQMFGAVQDLLQLESQRLLINYDRPPPHWVHADMSWPALKRKLKVDNLVLIPPKDQEEIKKVLSLVEKYTKVADVMGVSRYSATLLKHVLGRAVGEEEEASSELLGGAKPGKGVMSRMMRLREKKAMKVLKRELRGRHKTFALFYGAGHMAYFEMRLEKMGFEKVGVAWTTAWNVPSPATAKRAQWSKR